MAMNRPVAAEQQDHIGLLARGRHAHAPFDPFVRLEGLQIFRRTSQPEDGSRPHVRGETSRISSCGDSRPRLSAGRSPAVPAVTAPERRDSRKPSPTTTDSPSTRQPILAEPDFPARTGYSRRALPRSELPDKKTSHENPEHDENF